MPLTRSSLPHTSYGGVRFVLYSDRLATIQQSEDAGWQAVEAAFRELASHSGPILEEAVARRALKSQLQLDWFEQFGSGIRCIEERRAEHAARLSRARAEVCGSLAAADPKTGKPASSRMTCKELIVSMLESGAHMVDIHRQIIEKFPDTAAARNPGQHVAYYRSKMKTGKVRSAVRRRRERR